MSNNRGAGRTKKLDRPGESHKATMRAMVDQFKDLIHNRNCTEAQSRSMRNRSGAIEWALDEIRQNERLLERIEELENQ